MKSIFMNVIDRGGYDLSGLLKRIDRTTMKQNFYRMFTGYDAEGLLEEFWDKHQHKIFPWYPGQQEETDIIISASPEFLLQPICDRLGIRHLMASRVDPKTGKYTGRSANDKFIVDRAAIAKIEEVFGK